MGTAILGRVNSGVRSGAATELLECDQRFDGGNSKPQSMETATGDRMDDGGTVKPGGAQTALAA